MMTAPRREAVRGVTWAKGDPERATSRKIARRRNSQKERERKAKNQGISAGKSPVGFAAGLGD